MFVKNKGPGANAPEAVTTTTVAIKMNKSTINKNVGIPIIIFKSKLCVCRTRKILRDPNQIENRANSVTVALLQQFSTIIINGSISSVVEQ